MIRHHSRKKKIFLASVLITVLIAFALWPAIIFYPMGWIIYRHDHPAKNADAILILMGSPDFRPEVAAKALQESYAHRIIFVTPQRSTLQQRGLIPNEEELTLAVLDHAKIPRDKIIIISDFGRATSTTDEALALREYLTKTHDPVKRLIAVTSWGHTSRAGWTLEKVLRGRDVTIEMLPADKTPFELSNWWQSEDGLIFVFEEYIKWARYLVKYGGRDL